MNKEGLTPHINAQLGDFAKTVIMPGDPKRAQKIVETFLTNYKVVSNIRGIKGYTGYYKNKEISVMAHGMGNPSMGIYSYELFKFFDVDNIIRVGSCASYKESINLYDIIVSEQCFSYSVYASYLMGEQINRTFATKVLIKKLKDVTKNTKIKNNIFYGPTHAGDNFYFKNEQLRSSFYKKLNELGLIGGEMEAFALYANAKATNKNAIALFTVAHNSATGNTTTSGERQNSFTEMMKIALELSLVL